MINNIYSLSISDNSFDYIRKNSINCPIKLNAEGHNPESVTSKWIKSWRYVVLWSHWFRIMY